MIELGARGAARRLPARNRRAHVGVACGLLAGTVLLGAAPLAMADVAASERVSTTTGTSSARTNSDGQAAPHSEVSILAVSLTVGGAVAMTGSGVALVLTRRRAISRPPRQASR
ncbi:MAG: hypothetical protein DLM60_09835 [Pseudonocardiales bacterium]|nr:hypothetical protein [Actinomycetota bacterium]PZS19671.1 MAG: hypothetical protein DLM60_09835 [Pseudonocardiales bacterium]